MNHNDRRKAVAGILTVLDLVPKSKMGALLAAISDDGIAASAVGRTAGISSEAADGVAFLLEDDAVPRDTVVIALDAALAVEARAAGSREAVEMSWTGPVQFSGVDRGHAPVLADMIGNATKAVTVVGYSITGGADGVIRLLERAAKKGVVVTLVVHDDGGRANIDALRRAWAGSDRPRLFTRDASKEGPYYKIHAKLVVVDSSDMLVTSANLTWHGMNRNFEIGLRIRGTTARKGQALIDDLIASGYLEEVSW